MSESSPCPLESIKNAASRWVPRLDSGLTPEEEHEFEAWIEADPRHSAVLAEQQAVWNRFDSLAKDAHSEAAKIEPFSRWQTLRRVSVGYALTLLASAAVLMFAFVIWRNRGVRQTPSPAVVAIPSALEERLLADGSVVDLNRSAQISVSYSPATRRVELLKGEAKFTVTPNVSVPFIVNAGGVEVRAVGTAFDVRYGPQSVEVIVTKGKVQVTRPSDREASANSVPVLEVGQREVVALDNHLAAPQIAKLTSAEMERALAWQPQLLDFDDAPLAQIITEFNRHNAVHLVIRDSTLGALRLNASFRSDNLEGFVRLLNSHFGVQTESLGANEIWLWQAR